MLGWAFLGGGGGGGGGGDIHIIENKSNLSNEESLPNQFAFDDNLVAFSFTDLFPVYVLKWNMYRIANFIDRLFFFHVFIVMHSCVGISLLCM